jgi:hypothetical protein
MTKCYEIDSDGMAGPLALFAGVIECFSARSFKTIWVPGYIRSRA